MSENKSVNWLYFAVVGIYLALNLGLGVLSLFFPAVADMPAFLSVLLPQLAVLLPCLWYCGRKGVPIRAWLPFRKINFPTAVLVVVCTYLMYPLMIVLNALSMLFTNTGTTAVAGLLEGQNLLFGVVFVAMLPAFVEEFMFRGILFRTYRRSRLLPAIFLSAFLFGCMHMNLNQFVYAFALGIYLAFLVEATGSLLSSMLAHFTLNVTGVAVSALLPYLYGEDALSQAPDIYEGGLASSMGSGELFLFLGGIMIWGVVAIGTTAGAVGVYIAICKINKRWDSLKYAFRAGTGERMVTAPLVIAVLLTFAMMGLRIFLEAVGG